MTKGIIVCCAITVFFAFSSASLAYKTVPCRHGCSIEGMVEFTGDQVPKDPMLTLSSETEYYR